MCEPVSIAAAGLTAVKAVGDYTQGRAAARRQDDAWARNRASAIDSSKSETAASIVSFNQMLAGAAQKVNAIRREQSQVAGDAAVSAAEAGIEGKSSDILLMDVARRAEEAVASVDEGVENERVGLGYRLNEIAATATNRTNSMSKGVRPSVFDLGMGLAKAGTQLWGAADAQSQASKSSKV